MNQQMQNILLELSVCHDPEPEVIFRRIVQAIADIYGGPMALINLVEGERLRFRAVVNPHPKFQNKTITLQATFWQFALRSVCPLLIQNARLHPDFRRHLAVRLGLTRYLGVPIHNPQGEPIGTLCFLDDRTEQLLGEEDIRFLTLLAMRVSAEVERERMVRQRIAEAEATAARLEAAAEEKRRFVATIIHDLRHPLTVMRAFLHLLEEEDDPAERRHCLAMLENRMQAQARMLDALMQYMEIEAGRIPWAIRQIELTTLIEECIAGFAPTVLDGDVRFEREIAPDLGVARTDGGKLAHILSNLLSNALKFTPRGVVRVRAARDGPAHWLLEVEDTGIGMDAGEQQRIFEEFYRTPAARAGSLPGSGLGLAIVRQMCAAMNAQLSLTSAPGSGTRFCLRFPRDLPAESDASETSPGTCPALSR